jgi:hypothetical protein
MKPIPEANPESEPSDGVSKWARPEREWAWTVPLLVLAAAATVLVFLKHPGLGDDFTYWRFAFGLSEGAEFDWSKKGFHALRWPVWGVSYLVIRLVGPGLVSFYAAPFFYAALGTLVTYFLARKVVGCRAAGWTAALIFPFHPLLASVIFRPMPEVPEAVFGAAAIACWYGTMRGRGAGTKMLWAAAAGLALAVAHANRFTGILLVPVIGLLTLGFYRRQWGWFVAILGSAAIFFFIECAVYRQVAGDFWHSIHENLGARGRKGTEAVALWKLPFRFLDTLVQGKLFGVLLFLLALVGGWHAWTRPGMVGRLLVAWVAWLFLGYSCAIQGIDPPRPMIRDGPRFLGSLAVPLSVLAASGGICLWGWLGRVRGWEPARKLLARYAALIAVAAWAAMIPLSNRDLYDMDFVPTFAGYFEKLPAGTRLFTHDTVRELAFLMNGRAARRLEWEGAFDILEKRPDLDEAAARSDEFLYSRRLLLLRQRKAIQYRGDITPPELPSYFSEPEKAWRIVDVVKIEDRPDLVIHRRRTAADGSAMTVALGEGVLRSVPMRVPMRWAGGERMVSVEVPIPADLRGALVRVNIEASSNEVEAVLGGVEFLRGGRTYTEVEAKSHFWPVNALDFITFKIPEAAEEAKVTVKIIRDAEWIQVERLWLTIDPPK